MENNWNNTIGGRQQTLYYFESICVMEDGARGGATSKSLWVVLFTAVSVLWLKLICVKDRKDWII